MGHSRVPGEQIKPPCLALLRCSPQPSTEVGGAKQHYVFKFCFSHSRSFEPQPPQAVVVRWVGVARRTGSVKAAGASGHFQVATGAPPTTLREHT